MFGVFVFFFFFKQKTAYEMRISDWSSDVCSSDLCLRHCHGDDLGRNAMGSLSPRLPVPAWSAVVRSGRMAVLLSARLLLVVVLLRRLCTRDFHGRRGHCHVDRKSVV